MGGKNDSPKPPAYTPPPDNSLNEEMMLQFTTQMMGMSEQLAAMAAPQIPALPEIVREPVVDWAEKNKELLQRAKADYGVDQARKKGRSATVLTSPLLDDEEANTTSILT